MIELLTRPESDQCLLVVKCLEYRMSLDDLTIADATTGALLLRAQAEQAKARPTHVPFDATTDLIGEIEKQGWRVSDALEKPVPLISGKPYRVELTAGDCFGGTRRPATSDVAVLPRRP